MATALVACALAHWEPSTVKRGLFDTPHGLLHFVYRGNVSASAPLVFFHAHPRSTEEFRPLAQHIPLSQPFIAVDYYGAGASDECTTCDESKDEFIAYAEFSTQVMKLCDRLGVKKVIPFGALTGASPALEFAGQAGEQGRIDYLVWFEGYYLKPEAKAYVDNVFIPSIRHMFAPCPEGQTSLCLAINGSHVLDAWYRPDAAPLGPTSCGESSSHQCAPVTADLRHDMQKTIDWFENARTGWQFKIAWTRYNDAIPPRLKQLVALGVKFLFLHGTYADAMGDAYGLGWTWSKQHIEAIVPAASRTTVGILNGTEGSLEQNASVAAAAVRDFLGGWA
jgi:hypothetical protein